VAGTGVGYFPVSTLCIVVLLLLCLFFLARTGRYSPGLVCLVYGVFLLGTVSAALAHLRGDTLAVPQSLGSGRVALVGRIAEPVRYGPGRASAVVSVQRLLTPAESVPVEGRIKLNLHGTVPPLVVGDLIRFETKVRPPRSLQNPGGFDYAAHLRRSGVQAVGSVTLDRDGSGLRILASDGHAVMAMVDRWRGHIREAALRTLDPEAAGIYLALVTGEAGYLTPEVRDSFMAAGTTHILSISGSHLGLIGVVVFWVVRRAVLALPTRWLLRLSLRVTATQLAAWATIAPVTFYALLGGAEVATVRSLLMLFVFLGAILLSRDHNVGTGLAAAVLLIVAWDPLAPFDISFQLSFLSVLAILWLVVNRRVSREETVPSMPSRSGLLDRAWKGAAEVLLVSVAVTVAAAPLVAAHFNQLAWVGSFSNLLVVPLVGFLIVPLGLAACLATMLSGADGLVGTPLIQAALKALLWIVNTFAALPGAELRVASPPMWQILAFYLLLSAVVFSWGGCPRLAGAGGRVCGALALGLMLSWGWSPRDLPDAGTVRVTFIDVGQGDAALVETADGATMLIDGGDASGSYDVGRIGVAPLLWDRGIDRLNVVVATHPQQDHIGGLAFVARKFDIGEVWANGIGRDATFVRRLTEVLDARVVPVKAVSESASEIALGSCKVRVLNPRRQGEVRKESIAGKHQNNQSVVLRLDCGQTDFLFTGDVEREAEALLVGSGESLETAVLKVPHHGAKGSVYEPFLKAASPRLAVVSAGAGNPYGHPSPAMLETYARLGIPVLRTDRDGAVTVVGGASGIITTACESGHRLKTARFGRNAVAEEIRNLKRLFLGISPCFENAGPVVEPP
jgi:competence protein ComEC